MGITQSIEWSVKSGILTFDCLNQKISNMSNETGGRGRGTKRKVEQSSTSSSKKIRGELHTPSLAPDAFPKEYPMNKDGYRYILAEADIHAPFRQEFDESTEMAGKPIPGFLCRVLTQEKTLLAMHDRAPQVNVFDDRLTLTGHKFYCTIRANHSVNRGAWYFEVKIQELPEGAATRIGWAQKMLIFRHLLALTNLDTPLDRVKGLNSTKALENITRMDTRQAIIWVVW